MATASSIPKRHRKRLRSRIIISFALFGTALTALFPKSPEVVITTDGKATVPQTETGPLCTAFTIGYFVIPNPFDTQVLGATQTRKVDVRIICATNRSLEKEVAEGRFRQDLYYRLKVYPIRLPPLRERREDIQALAEHFLRKYSSEMKKAVSGFTPETLAQLSGYNWPGNVRELENEVHRLVIQAEPETFITPELLAPRMRQAEGIVDRIAPAKGPLKDMMEEVERFLLIQALRDHGGNKTRTAETLGITREGLHKKLAKFGL